MTDRKTMSSSALRRRRQAVKKLRAELKRELAAIEAEMACRKEPVVLRRSGSVTLSATGGVRSDESSLSSWRDGKAEMRLTRMACIRRGAVIQ